MTKVIRLSEETIRLLEIYRNNLEEEFKTNKMDMKDILKRDDLIIQNAIRTALAIFY